ncbi:MAG: hypothetical protein ACK458_13915 [Sphingobacteriales bacterium]
MQLLYRTVLAILFSPCVFLCTQGQEVPITDVIIIGVKHSPSPSFNSDSLFKVVANLKPDLILIEQDSVSSTFKSGVFKPFPDWVMSLRRTFGWGKRGVEYNFLHKYYHDFPKVIIKPMDVAFNGTDRKKYIEEYLQLEEDLEVAISEAYDRKEMSDYQSNVHLARKQLEAFAAARIYGSLQDINADSTTEALRQLDILENVHFKALVDSVPSLQGFSSRVHKQLQLAKFRDEEMVQQILRYIQEYRGKRIVVVVGVLHRYYQLDKLAPKREQLNFKILDINGAEMTFPSKISPWIQN